jgi:hypothetical protein
MSAVRAGIRAVCLALLVLPGAVGQARSVEYLDDMAAIQAAAVDQGIAGPFAPKPGPGPVRIVLEAAPAADHRVTVASVYCQAYGIDNPVSALLQDLIQAANAVQPGAPAGTDARPTVTLRIVSGSTVLRCLGKNDLAVICKNRVRVTADASMIRPDGSRAATQLVAQVEREGRVGGFCGNIARYTGIVTREAGIELVTRAQQFGDGRVGRAE